MIRKKSIQVKLLVFLFFILTVFVAAISIFAWVVPRRELEMRTNQTMSDSLEQIGKNVEVRVNSSKRYIYTMKNSREFKENLREFNTTSDNIRRNEIMLQLQRYIVNLSYKDENITSLFLYGYDRAVYAYGGVTRGLNELKSEPWYLKTMEMDGNIYSGGGYKNPIANSSVDKIFVVGSVLYSSDIYSEFTETQEGHEVLGSVFVIMDNERFSDIYKTMDGEYSGNITILDSENNIVSGEAPGFDIKELKNTKEKKNHGTLRTEVNGEKSLVFYYITPGENFKIISTVPESIYFSDINSLSGSLIIIAFIFYIFMLLIAYKITKQITSPIKMLYIAIKEMRGEGAAYDNEVEEIAREVHNMQDQIKDFVDSELRLEREKNQYELKALQYQINPHFFNNILSSIRFKVMKNNDTESAKMLETLANFMRRSITKTGTFVTVREELNLIGDMVYLYGVQYGCEINMEYRITPEQKKIKIPNMILQPLIENAMIHGISSNPESSVTIVECSDDNETVSFKISDNGVGISAEKLEELKSDMDSGSAESHIGMYNVKQRLLLHYGESSRMDFGGDETGFWVFLSFPKTTQ